MSYPQPAVNPALSNRTGNFTGQHTVDDNPEIT